MIALPDVIGLSLVFFSLAWLLLGLITTLVTRGNERLLGLVMVILSIIGFGLIIGLSASTPFRRALIGLDLRLLGAGLLRDLGAVAIGTVLAISVYGLARYFKRGSLTRFGLIVIGGIVIIFGGSLLYLYKTTFVPDLDQTTSEAAETASIKVAGDIPVSFFENKVTKTPTALEVGPEGELYVASIDGFIWVMRDENSDNVADKVTEFANGLAKPEGLAWGERGLYVNTGGALVLMKDTNGDDVADEKTTLIDGFPFDSYAFHQNNGLTFGPDGRLYIGAGSTTDHRPETNDKAARIFSMNPDGTDFKVYATGVRNPFGLIPAPDGQGFFAVDNGSSGCIDTERQVDDCTSLIDVPEEVNYITEGGDYGFPSYFGVPPQDSGTIPPMYTFSNILRLQTLKSTQAINFRPNTGPPLCVTVVA
ncbi:MAG: PQQ-dependent sugar dehydrogenase [Anaerolineae bacterium]